MFINYSSIEEYKNNCKNEVMSQKEVFYIKYEINKKENEKNSYKNMLLKQLYQLNYEIKHCKNNNKMSELIKQYNDIKCKINNV